MTSRQTELLTDLSVVKYEPKYKALIVVDSSKKVQTLTVDDKTKVEYNSATPTLTGAEALLTEGRRISVNRIGDRVLSLQVIYKYDGTYVSTDINNKKVVIKLSDGREVAVPYQGSTPSIELFGKSSGTIADLKVGDSVSAVLSANQDSIQTLYVKSSMQYEVVSVTSASNRIIATADGVSRSIYTDKATVLDENGNAIKISDISAGQTINVAYSGNTPVTVQVAKLTYGKVVSVDGSLLTVKSYTGSQEALSLTNGYKVIRGSSVSTSITSLTTSDHVVVNRDTDGKLIIKVLSSLERKFTRYNSSTKELYVIRTSMSDDNFHFTMNADTYIHEGDTTLSVQSLKENDKIVLYFNGDKLVEVEKQ
ncbi:hypothetical protein D3C81_1230320 [compost metagenome]